MSDASEPTTIAGSSSAKGPTASHDVILDVLARRREPPRPLTIVTSEDLELKYPPLADCGRYDQLRGLHAAA